MKPGRVRLAFADAAATRWTMWERLKMIKTGIIPLQNIHGIICNMTYLYDQALDEFKLMPQKNFTKEDIRRINKIMPHSIKAYIKADISEKSGWHAVNRCMPDYSQCRDRATCGLSGGQ